MEIAIADGLAGFLRLLPIALEDHVGARAHFADRASVAEDEAALRVQDHDVDTDPGNSGPRPARVVALAGGEVGLRRGEQGRRFGEAVDLEEVPAELLFEP